MNNFMNSLKFEFTIPNIYVTKRIDHNIECIVHLEFNDCHIRNNIGRRCRSSSIPIYLTNQIPWLEWLDIERQRETEKTINKHITLSLVHTTSANNVNIGDVVMLLKRRVH